LRRPLSVSDRNAVGAFRPTEQVSTAWQRSLALARALNARVILFQCPKSFLPTSENLVNFSNFFRHLDHEGFHLAWEPRGEAWVSDIVRKLCAEHDLIHCVDPFESGSVYGTVRYWRLHGRGAYSYKYTDADLVLLQRMLAKGSEPTYIMFNNFSSKVDALRFGQLL